MLKLKITTLILSILIMCSRVLGQREKKLIGNSEYSLADYSGSPIEDTLDVLKTHFKNCFCTDSLKGLQGKYKAEIMIEPQIVNLKSCDGLYSFRLFFKSGLSPRYFNGILHYVFLVSNNKVHYLNEIYGRDTLAVDKLIEELTPQLLNLYNEQDIKFMRLLGNRTMYWTDNSIEYPLMIYRNKDLVYFDNTLKK